MKTWWLKVGWPWLKENWWVVLLLPAMALVALGMIIMRGLSPGPVVVDPTKEADERAKVEAETRVRQLTVERARLAKELISLREEHKSLREHFEARLNQEVDSLRNDPEKLRQLMLQVGRQ